MFGEYAALIFPVFEINRLSFIEYVINHGLIFSELC